MLLESALFQAMRDGKNSTLLKKIAWKNINHRLEPTPQITDLNKQPSDSINATF